MVDTNISVIGLGKLGLPIVVVLAKSGFNVTGIDTNKKLVEDLNTDCFCSMEPDLLSYLRKYGSSISFTNQPSNVRNTTVSFIIVPTPSMENNMFDPSLVINAVREIGKELRDVDHKHLFVIVSTVMPGDTIDKIIPTIEDALGKKHGEGFDLCYNPEFIAIGRVIYDLENPDKVLIGSEDINAANRLKDIYTDVFATNSTKPKFISVNNTEAEIIKIHINSMVTAKITYANMITDLCETFPGVDIDRVTEGVGSDYRIGNKYLTGGLGFGGPCFPRDNLATQALYIRKGLNNYKIPLDIHFFNRDIPTKVSIITKKISQDRFGGRKDLTIGVIGASYKNDTICLDESQAVSIIGYLSKIFYKVMVYQKGLSVEMLLDCMRSNLAMPHVHNVSVESDMSKIVEYSNIIILPVLDPQTIFQEFNEVISRYNIGNKYFIDCWRQMPDKPNVIKFGLYHPIRDVKLQHWAD